VEKNHLALDGVNSRALAENQTRLGRGFFFPSRQRGKFKETSVKHGMSSSKLSLSTVISISTVIIIREKRGASQTISYPIAS